MCTVECGIVEPHFAFGFLMAFDFIKTEKWHANG
jgi:hypothetical protein